jgi:PHP family Zn ribbon phosphoesterase
LFPSLVAPEALATRFRRFFMRLSKHAATRLKSRGINFPEERLQDGFRIAKEKAARNCLVVYGSVGAIISVPNQSVLTFVELGLGASVVNIDCVVFV